MAIVVEHTFAVRSGCRHTLRPSTEELAEELAAACPVRWVVHIGFVVINPEIVRFAVIARSVVVLLLLEHNPP